MNSANLICYQIKMNIKQAKKFIPNISPDKWNKGAKTDVRKDGKGMHKLYFAFNL